VRGLGGAREGGGIGAERVGFFVGEDGEFEEGVAVAGEMAEVVPAHGVDVGLSDFIGELRVVPGEECVEVFVSEEIVLLYDLSIDVRGAQSFDLSNQIVTNALYGLDMLLGKELPIHEVAESHTLFVRSSRSGLISVTARILTEPLIFSSITFDRFSNSSSASIQFWSIGPSEIVLTTAGAIEISSTAGPRSFSTTLRFSSLVFKAVERD